MEWRKILLGQFLGVFLFASIASATAVRPTMTPPTANAYHYGDADADTYFTQADINIFDKQINGLNYTFTTYQADTIDADWNTCDVDSDLKCTGADENLLRKAMNGLPVTISDKPWVISAVNLQATINTAGIFIPFQCNISSNGGTTGRAGVACIANIVPELSTTTGSLKGRSCAPSGLAADELATPGDQCALAITITDWTTDPINGPALGLTETDPSPTEPLTTYGLQVQGDAPGTIYIDLSI